jgi:hypothetical protein
MVNGMHPKKKPSGKAPKVAEKKPAKPRAGKGMLTRPVRKGVAAG